MNDPHLDKQGLPRLSALAASLLGLLVLLLSSRMGAPSVPAGDPRGVSFSRSPAHHLTPEPALDAHAYLVRMAEDDTPLAQRRSGKRLAPASLTKLMTAFLAREILDPADRVTLSPDAVAVEEKRSGARAGEIFSRDDALALMLVASANDAALALATSAGRRRGAETFDEAVALFVGRMNERARRIGMRDTHFENPAGLDAPWHLSTAADLALLAGEILKKDPEIFAMTREPEIRAVSEQDIIHTRVSTNELLKEFPAILGGKTGMTDAAGGALLLSYPIRPAGTAIIVILKSADRFGDGRKIIKWLEGLSY